VTTGRAISLILAILIFLSFGAPVRAQTSPLTPELLSKFLSLMASNGTDRTSPPTLPNALGFSPKGQVWENRQLITPDPHPNTFHAFCISRDRDEKDVMVLFITPDLIHAFRAHRNGTAVAALIYDMHRKQLTMQDPVIAQKELDLEFVYWTVAFGQEVPEKAN
jgi:hypothetical protein